MKILFITPYSSEGASNRYRVEQYLPYLKHNGFECHISPFVSSEFYKIIYRNKYRSKKVYYFFKGLIKRISDIMKMHCYDIIFIHREACPFGPPVFEWLIYKFRRPMIFDFDDAIFMQNFNPANKIYSFLKFPSKVKHIIKMSTCVIVANRFLEAYARKYNANVYIIPTAIDTERFLPLKANSIKLTIGWIGSPTTAPYLSVVFNAMQKLSQDYSFVLKIIGAGQKVIIKGVNVENFDWQLESEIEDFQNIYIGIYPITDTLWSFGKAGFKAIQYMSVGVPVVASPVGITKEIIQDGINGFLANSDGEWVEKISRLIEEPDRRGIIGLAARKTVEDKFSVKVNAPKYLQIFYKAYHSRQKH